jgi:hypothetical protein
VIHGRGSWHFAGVPARPPQRWLLGVELTESEHPSDDAVDPFLSSAMFALCAAMNASQNGRELVSSSRQHINGVVK